MLTKVLKGNQNFIPIMIFILWGVGFYFLNVWNNLSTATYISAALIAIAVILITWAVNSLPYFKNNFYFAFLWAATTLLLFCCLPDLRFYSSAFFVLILFTQLILTGGNSYGLFNGFDYGFFMGIAIILYPPFWVLSAVMVVQYLLSGTTQLRSLIFYVIGHLAVVLLSIEVMAIWDLWEHLESFISQLYFTPVNIEWKELFLLPILLGGIIGGMDYFQNLNRQSVDKKAVFSIALLWLIGAIVIVILYGWHQGNLLIFIFLPILLYITNFLTYTKVEWYKEAMLWVCLVCLALYRFHHLIILPDFFDTVTF